MGKINSLNGCGSSGKTTISKAIQHLSSDPWLHIGIDNIINLMPGKFMDVVDKTDKSYYKVVPGKNERGDTIEINCTEKGCKIFDNVLGFEVDASIMESIKMGNDCFLIKISNKDGSPLISEK